MKDYIKRWHDELSDLFENDRIESAKDLNRALGAQYFDENQEPQYFIGNEVASTVFVMLNPGRALNIDYSFKKEFGRQFSDRQEYIRTYFQRFRNFKSKKYLQNKIDNFDLKQASAVSPTVKTILKKKYGG